MSQLFEEVMYNNIPRNYFDLSHDRKFSMRMGELTPVLVQEVVPGDSFTISHEQLIRMSPMIAPVMHRVNVSVHSFFVPNRLLWGENWEEFISDPLNSENPAPFIKVGASGIPVGVLMDYLGYPTGVKAVTDQKFNPFAISAYNLIWNEYYRDQNLQAEKEYKLVDGDNSATADIINARVLRPYRRAWQKDYFTSALPSPQKGEAVTIPIGGTANITYDNGAGSVTVLRNPDDGNIPASDAVLKAISTGTLVSPITGVDSGTGLPTISYNVDNSEQLLVDLTTATAININDLREASALQRWLEINARSGTRYIETLRARFGVSSDDARLQRPEYLGGGKTNISFSEVLQMSSSDATTPQGNMAGHGISAGQSNRFRLNAKEHGFIISIMSVMPDASYINPTPRWCTRLDSLDYLDPAFAQLGEQEVLMAEVRGDCEIAVKDDVFGYQSKYAEYKFNHNTVHGQFKSTLNYWHLSRDFATDPVLNGEFIECKPSKRIFAVEDEDEDELFVVLFNQMSATRPLPRYNIPELK